MVNSLARSFSSFVNALDFPLRRSQHTNLERYGQALLVRRQLPVRRLARRVVGPGKQHRYEDRRLRRFLGNDRLPLDQMAGALLRWTLERFGHRPFVPVMLDWTYVGDWAILSARIPYRGRSLPVLDLVHERAIARRTYSQTQAEIALLRRLSWVWPDTAPPPLILADRGFDKSRLLEWLLHGSTGKKPSERDALRPGWKGWLFLIRSCGSAIVEDSRGRRLQKRRWAGVGEQLLYPNVTYHLSGRFQLSLVIQGHLDKCTGKPASWELITNLPADHLKHAPELYRKRMWPEETYRDCKRGYVLAGMGLHAMKRLRRDRLERYLVLINIVYAFLVLIGTSQAELCEWLKQRHWGLSVITMAFDVIDSLGPKIGAVFREQMRRPWLNPDWT